jgi:hypothetical protein
MRAKDYGILTLIIAVLGGLMWFVINGAREERVYRRQLEVECAAQGGTLTFVTPPNAGAFNDIRDLHAYCFVVRGGNSMGLRLR